jgi:23S rRNA (pseudouridine1915-N3)-methyltransferase
MQIVFISVGKKHDEVFKSSIEDYTKRISKFAPVSWVIVPGEIVDAKDRSKGIRKETESILSKLNTADRVILLDEIGKEWSTVELAEFVEEMRESGTKRVVFIIGGAYGVDKQVRDRAHYIWSLSKLTFPHMLVRLILSEQVYRATSILHGSKYHHE